jgi:ABC-type polysaccharide/polyol phosphate transport system ATPase subunit
VTAIEVSNVSKVYPLRATQWARLQTALIPGAQPDEKGLWALRDVSFSLQKGETFGIVGANGSGKSTLLQIVAGILQPTSGSVSTDGRLSALLELGSGFAPEFTGRENVYLSAAISGLSGPEVRARFDAIESFAGIGDFMDQPIRTYSTGMTLRLAFAVAAHVDPEILVVDEALAVGDIAFRQRCMRRIHDLRMAGTTVLFVSHDAGDIKALCERGLWLEGGAVRMTGDADEVVSAYLHDMIERQSVRDGMDRARAVSRARPPAGEVLSGTRRFGEGGAEIVAAELVTAEGVPVRQWMPNVSVVLRVKFRVHASLPLPIAGFLVRNKKGENIFGSNSARENCSLPEMAAGEIQGVVFKWVMPDLVAGRYFISVGIADGILDRFEIRDYVEDAIAIDALGAGVPGSVYMRLECSGVTVSRE